MILIPIIITTVGFILALAVHPTGEHPVNVNTIGWILVIVGIIAFIADMLFWSSRGPRYFRRTTVVNDPAYPANPAYNAAAPYPPAAPAYPRRQVVEEEQAGGPAAGPPPPGY